jgi:hypothetical protein
MTDDQGPVEPKAMTIKAVPVATRKTMLALAKRRGETQSEWIARVVEKEEAAGRKDLIESLGLFDAGLPAVNPAPESGKLSMADIREAMGAARSIAESTGTKVPKVIARHVYALLTQRLREDRGLPPLAPRQTRPKKGQTTIEAEDHDA